MKTALFKSSHQIPESILTGWIGGNQIQSHKNQVRTIHRSGISTCQSNIITVVIYIILLVILCESCAFTWIGRSVGGDIGKPHFNESSDTRILKVSSERINYGGRNHVEVHKTDSSVITGIFKGFVSVPSDNDDPNYNQFIDSISHLAILPVRDELLLTSISNKSDCNIAHQFEGFYPSGIKFNKANDSYPFSPDGMIDLNNSDGTEEYLEKLNNSIKSKRLKLQNGVIILNDNHQKMIIPIGEIAYARCQRSERNGKLIGTAIGILIDFSIALIKTQDVMDDMEKRMNF